MSVEELTACSFISEEVKFKAPKILPSGTGIAVYKLYKDGECVYIGISENLEGRLYQHVRDKDFDSYSYFECAGERLALALERSLIVKLKPKYNKGIIGYRTLSLILRDLKNWDYDDLFEDLTEEQLLFFAELIGIDINLKIGEETYIPTGDGDLLKKVVEEHFSNKKSRL